MRRMTFVLGVLLGIACDQSEMFDGEPCHVDKDCWHDQECTRTEQERLADLPGVCADEGTGCLPGEQLGCVCDPDDSSLNCSYAAAPIGEAHLQIVAPSGDSPATATRSGRGNKG